MRKLVPMLTVAAFSCLSLVVFAAEVKTITGEGQCAKCSLKEKTADGKCQNAIKVEEGGKTVTYYLENNAVSKKFHKNVCQEIKTVKATGDVKEESGKMVMTPEKIDVVE